MYKKPPINQRNRLGDKEIMSLLARASVSGLIRVPGAARVLKRPAMATALLLGRLEKKGWAKRVKPGTYYILPLEATKREGGVASDPWLLAAELFAPCYIGGWSAAEHWGLTEQLFRSTFIVTAANVRAKTQHFLGSEFRLVRVPTARITATTSVWRGSTKVLVSDRERTLIDGLANPLWVGGFRHLTDMIRTYLVSDERNDARLLACVRERGRGSVAKRLGFVIERLDPKATRLIAALRQRLPTGVIKLDPTVAARGLLNRTWGVWENVSLRMEPPA